MKAFCVLVSATNMTWLLPTGLEVLAPSPCIYNNTSTLKIMTLNTATFSASPSNSHSRPASYKSSTDL